MVSSQNLDRKPPIPVGSFLGACALSLLCFAPSARASFQEGASADGSGTSQATKQEAGILPVRDYSGGLTERPALSGDWGGTRQEWADKGLTFLLNWYQVAQGVVDGGTDDQWAYGTNLDLYAKLDFDRMGFIPGGLLAFRAQSRFGSTVNGDTGLLLPVNTWSNFPLTSPPDDDVPFAITELNYTQFFSEEFGVLFGKVTTMGGMNEFAGGEGRTQFMNFQFLFPAVYAQVAPYSTLAAGAVWLPSNKVTATSLVMNTTDSSTTTGFDDFGDGATWWNSIEAQYRVGGLPGGSTLGFLYAFNGDYSKIGGLNFQPGLGFFVQKTDHAWALQWNGWQYLHVEGDAPETIDTKDGQQDLQGLGLFASLGLGDEDTNPVSWVGSIGLGARGLFHGRDDDTLGLGYFYNGLQDPRPILANVFESSTRGLELYYNAALLKSVSLTPNFQWAQGAATGVDDSITIGFRLNVEL